MNADQLHALHADARAARRRAQSALDFFRDRQLPIEPRKRAQLIDLERRLVSAVEAETQARLFAEQGKRGFLTPTKEESNDDDR